MNNFFLSTAALTLSLTFTLSSCDSQSSGQNGHEGTPNGLINETSPYLLQHAYNPVNWQPWGEEALSTAKQNDKLVIISIGYAACHWCHVMEKESFSDSATALLMNDNFVSIKVDREERPDVDQVYMDAALLINGRGGWPLNIIALPDGKPVYAGTYFPNDNWLQVLGFFRDTYKNDKQKILDQAEQVTQGLSTLDVVGLNTEENELSRTDFENYRERILGNIDMRKGGRKGAPKFPTPIVYETLLEIAYYTENEKALDAVTITSDNMGNGGIYDHLGGGFSRYSTDDNWKVPHFEKMLYDNAQLISLYSHVFQVTQNPQYEQKVRETIAFSNRDLRDDNGGYYSSLDADSEGEEGKYYVWEATELKELLGSDSDIYLEAYQATKSGNWEGKNILFRRANDLERVGKKFNRTPEDISDILKLSNRQLFEVREKRVSPPLDDKVLTALNGLMIKGLVDAYFAFEDESYLKDALKTAEFLVENQLRSDGGLNRSYRNGRSTINGFLDDYAFTIEAFIRIYNATFDAKWLKRADELMTYVRTNFINEETKMFYYTSSQDDPLITRKTDLNDGDIPSSNSSIAHSLYQLGHYYYRDEDIKHARQMLNNMMVSIEGNPYYYTNWIRLHAKMSYPFYEVAIVGDDADKKRDELFGKFIPNAIIIGGKDEGSLELLENKKVDGKTMIYVCENKTCRLPVDDPEKALTLINNK